MKLLYPDFLWGLTALSIPIIIHLFNFRKFKKVYFSNIELLKEVELETKSKSRLKHLIVLLIRLLAVTFLVLAFSQPYIPVENEKQHGEASVSIYIDNSHSMDTKGENGYLLDIAKEQAISIANTYKPTDRFQILTNDLEPIHQRLVSKDEFIALVEDVKPSFTTRGLDEIYLRQSDALMERTGSKDVYWMSDFQKSNLKIEDIKKDTSLELFLLPFSQEGKGNVYIDSIWFETPIRKMGSEDVINARVINDTKSPIEFKVELTINNTIQGFGNFSINENSSINCSIPYTLTSKGTQYCKLKISEYPNPDMLFDDEYFFSYNIKGEIKVLQLTEKKSNSDSTGFIGNLFAKNNMFSYSAKSIDDLDFSTLSTFDLIISNGLTDISSGLSNEFINYTNQGGNLLLFPSENSNVVNYNSFLNAIAKAQLFSNDTSNAKVGSINLEHPIYKDVFDKIPDNVDYPKISDHYPITYSSSSGTEHLMKLQNNNPFFSLTNVKKGKFYFCNSPLTLSASNFPKHALFVATLLRIGEFSQSAQSLSYIVGTDNSIDLDQELNSAETVTIKKANDEFEFIPEIKNTNGASNLLLYDQINKSGHYSILSKLKEIGGISFNYNRLESKFEFYNNEELTAILAKSSIGNQTKIIEGADSSTKINFNELVQGKQFWWQCIFFVILLLGAEIAVLRLWK